MKLATVLKPGFRRPITITPDQPVDRGDTGAFLAIEVLSGDSTVTVDPASTATSLKFWVNGDGAVGDKSIRVSADGRIGAEVVTITLDIDFTVASPDATSLAALAEGADELIPV